jgi:myo-inositol 2-dehydrogenase/D-chiro-inositol 1-dehydrogenase
LAAIIAAGKAVFCEKPMAETLEDADRVGGSHRSGPREATNRPTLENNDMINAAIFGAGRIGKVHTHNIAGLPGVALRYVVDVNPAAAAELEVHAVVIATSTDTHADLIQRAAAAGKAIFCEKPVDLALERARLCAEAVTRAGVLCGIGFQRRFDPTFAALKTRLDAGEIGEPETLLITSRE